MLTTLLSLVNATNLHQLSSPSYPNLSVFDDDLFFQSNDVVNQIRSMHQTIDNLIEQQFKQLSNNSKGFLNAKNKITPSQKIQMSTINNELRYTIPKPEGRDSKVDVFVKNGVLIVNTHLMEKTTYRQNGTKAYSYSQSSYTETFKLPKGYDPNSMDMKTKDAAIIVRFKKQHALANSLII